MTGLFSVLFSFYAPCGEIFALFRETIEPVCLGIPAVQDSKKDFAIPLQPVQGQDPVPAPGPQSQQKETGLSLFQGGFQFLSAIKGAAFQRQFLLSEEVLRLLHGKDGAVAHGMMYRLEQAVLLQLLLWEEPEQKIADTDHKAVIFRRMGKVGGTGPVPLKGWDLFQSMEGLAFPEQMAEDT